VSAVTAEDWNLPIALVGYGRCSTAEQGMDGVSIEVQRRAVQSLADRKGWDMARLADEGISGAVSPEERKRFKVPLALLEAGESEALIFTKVDMIVPGNHGTMISLVVIRIDLGPFRCAEPVLRLEYCAACRFARASWRLIRVARSFSTFPFAVARGEP